jgi:hypothetical protein
MTIKNERRFICNQITVDVLYESYGHNKFCYNVCNQHESFICPNLMVKNRDVTIKRYLSVGPVLN